MVRACPRCARINPAEALFCYEDGAPLAARADPGRPLEARSFPVPFVFESGRTCRSFDELALACLDDPPATLELLRRGILTSFFASLGRTDLAAAARSAARSADPSQALDHLLEQLPTQTVTAPSLHVAPAQVNLGIMAVGDERHWDLCLTNQGMRLLAGSIRSDCFWLRVGDGRGAAHRLFECFEETRVPVHVQTRQVRAGNRPLQGRLLVETNGGNATVLVSMEVPVTPFPGGVLAGALTPRELAQKARTAPLQAAPLFEQGVVARWYEGNGWIYPVLGPAAAGIGAVQQFFEALGLTTPPRVAISTDLLRFQGCPGQQVSQLLRVWAEEKRPVYVNAVSAAPWLRVVHVQLDGRFAAVHLAAVIPEQPGDTLRTTLTVTANGNQRFTVTALLEIAAGPLMRSRATSELAPIVEVAPVEPTPPGPELLEVLPAVPPHPRRIASAPGPEPILDVLPADKEPRRQQHKGRALLHALPAVALMIAILTAIFHDLLTCAWQNQPDLFPSGPRIAIQFHDQDKLVTLGPGGGVKAEEGRADTRIATWEGSMRFGLVTRGSELWPMGNLTSKRLTFDERGRTNNTCIRLDGRELLFGERPFRLRNGEEVDSWPGRWQLRSQPTTGEGRQAIWIYDGEQVVITQTVELVAGEQSGLLDTCLVRYRMDNRDHQAHTVGLRFLLDTYIGSNDGVPFLIPGDRQLCDTMLDLRSAGAIPAYVQALEREDLANPGTIVQVCFKVGGGLEPPSRVTLGAWPDPQLRRRDRRCRQEKTLWEVPVLPIKSLPPGDSALTMYWPERPLAAGGTRDVGFTCGLGSVSGGESKGKVGLTIGGSFTPGGELDLTAYVHSPEPGLTVALTLPDALTLRSGKLEQVVPPLPANATTRISPVTWRVQAREEGEYNVSVRTSAGVTQTQRIVIKTRGIFGS